MFPSSRLLNLRKPEEVFNSPLTIHYIFHLFFFFFLYESRKDAILKKSPSVSSNMAVRCGALRLLRPRTPRLYNRLFHSCVCTPSSLYSPVPSRLPASSFAEEREFVAVARSRVFRMSPAPMGLAPREAVIRNKNASTGGIYAN